MGIILINIDNIDQYYVLKNKPLNIDICLNDDKKKELNDKINKYINKKNHFKIIKKNDNKSSSAETSKNILLTQESNKLVTIFDKKTNTVVAIIAKINNIYIIQIDKIFYNENIDILEIKEKSEIAVYKQINDFNKDKLKDILLLGI